MDHEIVYVREVLQLVERELAVLVGGGCCETRRVPRGWVTPEVG